MKTDNCPECHRPFVTEITTGPRPLEAVSSPDAAVPDLVVCSSGHQHKVTAVQRSIKTTFYTIPDVEVPDVAS